MSLHIKQTVVTQTWLEATRIQTISKNEQNLDEKTPEGTSKASDDA